MREGGWKERRELGRQEETEGGGRYIVKMVIRKREKVLSETVHYVQLVRIYK